MKLYITDRELPPLYGTVIKPQLMGLKIVYLTLASQIWDTPFIDVDKSIQEGSLRFLYKKCKHISVCCPEHPTIHRLYLLVESHPKLDGKLRKAFLKGGSIRGILPETWEHGGGAGRDIVWLSAPYRHYLLRPGRL